MPSINNKCIPDSVPGVEDVAEGKTQNALSYSMFPLGAIYIWRLSVG